MNEVRDAPELPASWTVTTIGQVVLDILGGGTPDRSNAAYYSGSIPWMTIKDMRTRRPQDTIDHITQEAVANSATRVVPADTLIVATRVGLGKVARVSFPTAINQDLKALILPNHVDKGFLEYWFVANANLIESLGTGTTVKGIRLEELRNLSFPLPPHPEQRRIVEAIDALFTRLDAAVDALRRVRANLKRYRASVLRAACSGELLDNDPAGKGSGELAKTLVARLVAGRTGRNQPLEPNSDDLPSLPPGWTWATLDQLGQPDRPIIYGIIKPGPHDPAGVPYVRVTEMKDGHIDVGSLKKASPARAEKFKRARLQGGDVLISKDGTIGRVAVVPPELAGGNITQHVMRAPIHALINRQYVVWAIRSPFCQKWLTGETRGVALRGVNVEDFRRLPIPLPPLDEQGRIADEIERRLSVADALVSEVEAGLKRCTRMRQAILKKGFEGNLVAQDPKDAPVSLMLERMNGSDVVGTRGRPNRRARRVPSTSPSPG